ncbi:hypothetical protein BT63DRAFT_189093 [Microthyrium microscopicum]|uniref:Uncharacterized protein n=1 Tax=Microthyrium microscopicum TaxID=703497 RepID=A0A6A6UKT8_9PEZI|nr:hypothetical protein BT63DRAFT_189093 [Microthyrium microscopicum]
MRRLLALGLWCYEHVALHVVAVDYTCTVSIVVGLVGKEHRSGKMMLFVIIEPLAQVRKAAPPLIIHIQLYTWRTEEEIMALEGWRSDA